MLHWTHPMSDAYTVYGAGCEPCLGEYSSCQSLVILSVVKETGTCCNGQTRVVLAKGYIGRRRCSTIDNL